MSLKVINAVDLAKAARAEARLELVDQPEVVGLDLEAPCRVDGLAAFREVGPYPRAVVGQILDLFVDGFLPEFFEVALDGFRVALRRGNVSSLDVLELFDEMSPALVARAQEVGVATVEVLAVCLARGLRARVFSVA